MAAPKKRKSIRKRAENKLHLKITELTLTRCKDCGRSHRTHFACESCNK